MTTASAPKRPSAASMGFTLAVLVFGTPASAKAGADLDAGSPDEPNPGATVPKQTGSDHWTLGTGITATPEFQGSDEYEARPLPLIDVRYGRFFAKVGEGIGVDFIQTATFTAGAGVDWMQGYDRGDVPEGIDEVDDALGARLFASTRFEGTVATIAATQAVTESDRGLIINADLAYPVHATGRLTITPSLGTTWANEKYMNSYFGIDSSEATASGFGRYRPANGLKDASFRVSASYRITDSISAVGSIGVTHLLDAAADSPLVEQQTQSTALMGVTYTF